MMCLAKTYKFWQCVTIISPLEFLAISSTWLHYYNCEIEEPPPQFFL